MGFVLHVAHCHDLVVRFMQFEWKIYLRHVRHYSCVFVSLEF